MVGDEAGDFGSSWQSKGKLSTQESIQQKYHFVLRPNSLSIIVRRKAGSSAKQYARGIFVVRDEKSFPARVFSI